MPDVRLPCNRIRRRLLFTALVVIALVGCGSPVTGPRTLFSTSGQVVALDAEGHDLAWLTARDGTTCSMRLWLRRGTAVDALRLPSAWRKACFYPGFATASIALSGASVGWRIDDEAGETGEVEIGISSAGQHSPRTLLRERTAGPLTFPYVGTILGGVAADGAGVLIGSAHVSYRPHYRRCAVAPWQRSCETRVDGGGVRAWQDGRGIRLRALPAVGAIAAHGAWIAILPWVERGWVRRESPSAPLRLTTRNGRVLATIHVAGIGAPNAVPSLALSDRLLAVTDGARVFVYRVPDGKQLLTLRLPHDFAIDPVGGLAVGDREVVLWSSARVLAVDVATGRRRVLTDTGAFGDNESIWTITAAAVDADTHTFYWALSASGGSIVRALSLPGGT